MPEEITTNEDEANQPSEGVQARVELRYEKPFRSYAVSHVSLSRIGADIQLDLGSINLQNLVEELRGSEDGKSRTPVVDVDVLFSCLLTPTAFINLHREINRFYDQVVAPTHDGAAAPESSSSE